MMPICMLAPEGIGQACWAMMPALTVATWMTWTYPHTLLFISLSNLSQRAQELWVSPTWQGQLSDSTAQTQGKERIKNWARNKKPALQWKHLVHLLKFVLLIPVFWDQFSLIVLFCLFPNDFVKMIIHPVWVYVSPVQYGVALLFLDTKMRQAKGHMPVACFLRRLHPGSPSFGGSFLCLTPQRLILTGEYTESQTGLQGQKEDIFRFEYKET